MSRNIDPTMASALASGAIRPFFMAELHFKSSVQWMWSGVGNLVWDSQTFIGVGSFAKIGNIQEGTDVNAYGTTVTLSGIDPVLLQDSLTDMQPGAQAVLWLGLMTQAGTILGSPYQLFAGTMDQPSVNIGNDTLTITIALESRLLDLKRAQNSRYTSADQRRNFPTDTAFGWVEQLNDLALIWGQ
jgi:hypothetical protein